MPAGGDGRLDSGSQQAGVRTTEVKARGSHGQRAQALVSGLEWLS